MSTLTIRIADPLRRELEKVCRRKQQPLSDVVRESLKCYLAAEELRHLRHATRPRAEARGFLADEDVFKVVS